MFSQKQVVVSERAGSALCSSFAYPSPFRLQNEQFPYCQSWVLGWQYRKQNLLKELLGYSADIVCLQEVRPPSMSYCVQCLPCGHSLLTTCWGGPQLGGDAADSLCRFSRRTLRTSGHRSWARPGTPPSSRRRRPRCLSLSLHDLGSSHACCAGQTADLRHVSCAVCDF